MTPKLSNALVVGALVSVLAACGGCALTAASVVPSALGASPVIVDSVGAGKADSFWAARYDDVVQATLRAGEKLSLELDEKEIEEDRTRLRYRDARDVAISLRIERRTDTVTRVRFDVGSTEFSGFGRLLSLQIVAELRDADAFVVDWSVKKNAPLGLP